MTRTPSTLSIAPNPKIFIRSNDAEKIQNKIRVVPGFEKSDFDTGPANDTNSVQEKLFHLPRWYKRLVA